MYLEWMHEKYLRNIKLNDLQRFYMHRTACRMARSPIYPPRPTGIHEFQSIGGFTVHPNSTQDL
jgi:hypothetical protein